MLVYGKLSSASRNDSAPSDTWSSGALEPTRSERTSYGARQRGESVTVHFLSRQPFGLRVAIENSRGAFMPLLAFEAGERDERREFRAGLTAVREATIHRVLLGTQVMPKHASINGQALPIADKHRAIDAADLPGKCHLLFGRRDVEHVEHVVDISLIVDVRSDDHASRISTLTLDRIGVDAVDSEPNRIAALPQIEGRAASRRTHVPHPSCRRIVCYLHNDPYHNLFLLIRQFTAEHIYTCNYLEIVVLSYG